MTSKLAALAAFFLIATLLIATSPTTVRADWPGDVFAASDKAKRDAQRRRKLAKKRAKAKRINTSKITTGSIGRRKVAQPQKCVAVVSVVGDQAATMKGARAQAEKAWQQQIRFRYGELYSDPRNAGKIAFRCVDSSIRNFANRATEAIGINSQLKRCSMSALPCRAPSVIETTQ